MPDLTALEKLVITLVTAFGLITAAYYSFRSLRLKAKIEELKPSAVPRVDKPRVLIIDDDPDELDEMRLTLNGDYDLVLCRHSYRAIAEIAMQYDRGHAFSLIILDCLMYPMMGDRIVQVIRLMEMDSEIRSPIAYFTRMGNVVKKPASVSVVWRKPEDHLTLRQKVREMIEK